LEKVEDFINKKGHLPNTPSAEEIQNEGLELGKITTNQQEKIEELFLHLIEMEKRISELEKENQELKSQIIKK
jgi:TolA-binding protein